MKCTVKKKSELATSKWSGGSTTELFIFPHGSSYQMRNFEIRVSSATVDESPSTFTSLPSYHRVLMPLSAPLKLISKNGESSPELSLDLSLNPFETAEFEGAWNTVSHGLCTDIGIMLSSNWRGKLHAADSGIHKCPPGFTCIYAISDNIEVSADNKKHILSNGDFLILETDTDNNITLNLPEKNAAIVLKITRVF